MKQHYVTASYLTGFVDTETPAGMEPYLWVATFETNTVKRRAPVNVAAVTDYNVVFGEDGEDSHAAEAMFSEIESEAIPIIRAISQGRRELDNEAFGALNAHIALQYVRIPAVRDQLIEFRLSIARKTLQVLKVHPAANASCGARSPVASSRRRRSNGTEQQTSPIASSQFIAPRD